MLNFKDLFFFDFKILTVENWFFLYYASVVFLVTHLMLLWLKRYGVVEELSLYYYLILIPIFIFLVNYNKFIVYIKKFSNDKSDTKYPPLTKGTKIFITLLSIYFFITAFNLIF